MNTILKEYLDKLLQQKPGDGGGPHSQLQVLQF